jgi:hypothetical protein
VLPPTRRAPQRLLRGAHRAGAGLLALAGDPTGEITQALPLFLHQPDETFAGVTACYVDDGTGGQTVILYIARGTSEALGQEASGRVIHIGLVIQAP